MPISSPGVSNGSPKGPHGPGRAREYKKQKASKKNISPRNDGRDTADRTLLYSTKGDLTRRENTCITRSSAARMTTWLSMNERANERRNEWMNVWMKERQVEVRGMKEWTNKRDETEWLNEGPLTASQGHVKWFLTWPFITCSSAARPSITCWFLNCSRALLPQQLSINFSRPKIYFAPFLVAKIEHEISARVWRRSMEFPRLN